MRRNSGSQFLLLLAILLSATSGRAMDITLPAEVRVTVRNESDEPVSGARVQLLEGRPMWPPRLPGPLITTGPDGTVLLSESRPAGAAGFTWSVFLQVEAEGYFPGWAWMQFFPGAHFEQAVQLEPIRTTRIRLRGPNQEPLRRIPLHIVYIQRRTQFSDYGSPTFLFTDDQGECLWQHPSLPEGFHLVGRPEKEILPDQPVVTVSYNADQVPKAAPLLRGKLLRADDSPAEGWYAARKARLVGAGGIFSGVILESMMIRTIQVEQLAPIGPGGAFEVDAERYLVLVSPEGMPMLYQLAPETWESEVRELTLRVPEVRERTHGQVRYEDGQPVSGFSLQLREILSEGHHWEIISGRSPGRRGVPLAGTRASDRTVIPGFRTDSQGRYSLPQYYGTIIEFHDDGEGWSLKNTYDAERKNSVLRRSRKTEHGSLKDLLLAFQDEQGRPITEIRSPSAVACRGGKPVPSFHAGAGDAQGRHIFVEKDIDQVELHYHFSLGHGPQPEWKQLVDVSGPEDRTVQVTIPRDRCPLPLTGTVLDPEGQLLKQVRVLLYDPALEKYGNEYISVNHVTDDTGHFHFEIAPDNCFIEVLPARENEEQGLPGWLPVTKVDRTTRNLTVQLSRGGTIRILLPHDVGHHADGLFLERKDEEPDVSDRSRYAYFVPGRSTNELHTRIIPPGRYQLGNDLEESKDAFAALGTIQTEVRVDEVAVIDLREWKLPPAEERSSSARRWTTVTVKQGERIVSGAEVTVLSRVASEADLSQWLGEATDQYHLSPEVRAAAIEKLRETGAQAVDAIRTDRTITDKEKLLQELKEVEFESDGWNSVLMDLSDDHGQVRCQIDSGYAGVTIARVRGWLIGWQQFSADNESVTIQLRPARTLIVERPQMEKDREANHESLWLRMDHTVEPGIRGLMSLLSGRVPLDPESSGWIDHEAVFEDQYPMLQDRPNRWVMEDLPVGAAGTLILMNDSPERSHPLRETKRVTIEPGDGAQQLQFRSPIRKRQKHPAVQKR